MQSHPAYKEWLLALSAMACVLLVTTARTPPAALWLLCAAAIAACARFRGLRALSAFPAKALLPGLAVSAFLGYTFFYCTWLSDDGLEALCAQWGLPVKLVVLGLCGVLIVAAAPFITALCVALYARGKQALRSLDDAPERRFGLRTALPLLCAAQLLGLTAVLRANFYYIDDLGRAAYGYKEWGFFSRFLSAALSGLLHADSYLTDISPLPQLIAACIIGVSGAALLCAVTGRRRFSAWELIAVVPLGLNPYFLECYSYKYDAPYMALSILAGILPLLLVRQKRSVYCLASATGALVMCTTYQAASGIYPIVVIALAVRQYEDGQSAKETLRFCVDSAAAYLAGLLFFKAFILSPQKTYAGTLAGPGELPTTLLQNYRAYAALLTSDWKTVWLVLLGAVALGFVLTRRGTRGRMASLLLRVSALPGMMLLCLGVYPALQDASFDPRAMYGIGVLTALLCLSVADTFRPATLAAAALSWCFFVFSFTYGNALYAQKTYTEFRVENVAQALNEMPQLQPGETVRLEITGSIGSSPILENMPQDYDILNRLVPETFCGDWMWGEYGIRHYYALKNTDWVEGMVTDPDTLTVYADTLYYTIRYGSDCIQVELK